MKLFLLSLCGSVYLFIVCLSICLSSVYLPTVCLSSACLSICLSSACLSFCLSSVSLYVCLSIVSLSVCLSAFLLSQCLFLSIYCIFGCVRHWLFPIPSLHPHNLAGWIMFNWDASHLMRHLMIINFINNYHIIYRFTCAYQVWDPSVTIHADQDSTVSTEP